MSHTPDLLSEAVRALGIDVPVVRVDDTGNGLTLYLYGGGIARYQRPNPGPVTRPAPKPPAGEDLTAIPGIGRSTARALKRDGIRTIAAAIAAYHAGALEPYLQPGAAAKIEAWLEEC